MTALSRGLDVLSCFRSGSRLLGNQDISERCRLPKSTVSRLTYTLTKLGYLHYVKESGKYRLGTATLALGSAVLGRFEVRDLARPLMQELADATGTSVALGARQRLSMVCVEVCKGNAVLSLNMEVGMRLPLAISAIGRAYLAVCSDSERADLLDQIKELDHLAWPAHQAGHRQVARDVPGDRRVQLVRRMAAGRERHRGRLPSWQWPAADGDQLRCTGVQGVVGVPAQRSAAAPHRAGAAHRRRPRPGAQPERCPNEPLARRRTREVRAVFLVISRTSSARQQRLLPGST